MGLSHTRSGPSIRELASGIHGVDDKLQRIVKRVGQAELEIVRANTPRQYGLLEKGMEEHEFTPYRASIAPVGDPSWHTDEPAPEGTIRAFVSEYIRILGERPGGGPWAPWRSLSPKAKELLRQWRLGGNTAMGGPYPPPVYFGAIERGRVPDTQNANEGFGERIRDLLRERCAEIVREVLR